MRERETPAVTPAMALPRKVIFSSPFCTPQFLFCSSTARYLSRQRRDEASRVLYLSAHGSRLAKPPSVPDTRAHRGERGFFSSLYAHVYERARPRRTMMKSVMHALYFLAVVAAAGISFFHRVAIYGSAGAGSLISRGIYISVARATDGKIVVASAA